MWRIETALDVISFLETDDNGMVIPDFDNKELKELFDRAYKTRLGFDDVTDDEIIELSSGAKVTGNLSEITEEDLYTIKLSGGGTIKIDFDSPLNSSNPYFHIYSKLHPLASVLSNLPRILNVSFANVLPKSSVAINGQE